MILLKALIPAHDRHLPDGRPVPVRAYTRRSAPAAAHATPPVVSYSSGASSRAHLEGYIHAGSPVGVSLTEFADGSPTWDMVVNYARAGGAVFVDSGAFPAFTKGQAVDWDRHADLVAKLCDDAAGGRLHVMMPDVIGDQDASMRLLQQRRGQVLDVIAGDHDALVAIQRGQLSPRDCWRKAASILGTRDFTAAVPSNKAAFTPADVADLMRGPDRPDRVHFLGVAGNLRKLAALAAIVHQAHPGCVVTSDANRIRAKVGEGRPMTAARNAMMTLMRDMHVLLDDPEHKRMWLEQHERAAGPAATGMAVILTEAADRRQPDLLTGTPLRKALRRPG